MAEKKTRKRIDRDELRPEYEIDYSRARPNPYAKEYLAGSRVVVLEPDVAKIFRTGVAVNSVLRAILAAIPSRKKSGNK
jgi:hypothetical protein